MRSISRTAIEFCRIQVAGRFVGQHDGGPGDERTGDGNSLLLAAGQLRGPMIEPAADTQQFSKVVQTLVIDRLLVRLVAPADLVGNLDVAACGERRQQVELLEDKADFRLPHLRAFTVVERGEVDVINQDIAGRGSCQAAEDVEQSRLATAGGGRRSKRIRLAPR